MAFWNSENKGFESLNCDYDCLGLAGITSLLEANSLEKLLFDVGNTRIMVFGVSLFIYIVLWFLFVADIVFKFTFTF